MSKSVLQLIENYANNSADLGDLGDARGVENEERGLRELVAECMGRFIDLHQHHRDPLQAMMSWVEQLRGERGMSMDRDNITSTVDPDGKVKAALCMLYRVHHGHTISITSHERAAIFEYFERAGIWNDEMRAAAVEGL